VIVKKRGYCEPTASPEDLRRLRQQIEAGTPLDADLKPLFVKDTLKQTMKKVMGWSGHADVEMEGSDDGLDPSAVFAEADAMKQRGGERTPVKYRQQEGVIVSRLNTQQIPGGCEPLQPTMLHHPGFEHADSVEAEYLRCAQELQDEFQRHSDRKFLLMDPELQAGVTLVTVCITPIMAAPRATVGLELLCEFHQTTRFGFVDTTGFEVYSEIGKYPINPPSSMDLLMMMHPADAILGAKDPASQG
jgi:hypothetical protein